MACLGVLGCLHMFPATQGCLHHHSLCSAQLSFIFRCNIGLTWFVQMRASAAHMVQMRDIVQMREVLSIWNHYWIQQISVAWAGTPAPHRLGSLCVLACRGSLWKLPACLIFRGWVGLSPLAGTMHAQGAAQAWVWFCVYEVEKWLKSTPLRVETLC
jgi:hypothetical protein